MALAILTESVRLQYLQAMRIPVWKLRSKSYKHSCYKALLKWRDQPLGYVIAQQPVDSDERASVLLQNIIKALDLNLSADLSIGEAPTFKALSDSVQMVLILGKNLGLHYERSEQLPIAFGQITDQSSPVVCCTAFLS